MPSSEYHYQSSPTMPASGDAELAVAGGTLELEDVPLSSLSAPLLLRGGGDDPYPPPPSSLMPELTVEQTPQSDGSVAVKATTATPHPNGYRDLKIEHFVIPASCAKTVDLAPGAPPPASEYLTHVEYRVLSPGSDVDPPDDDVSTVYTAPAPSGDGSVATARRRRKRKRRNPTTLLFVAGGFVFVAVIVVVALARDYNKHVERYGPEGDPSGDNGAEEKNATTVDPEPNATGYLLAPE